MSDQLTPDQMREALALEKKAREQACLAELEQVLLKHGCRWGAVPMITQDGRTVAQIMVTAVDG